MHYLKRWRDLSDDWGKTVELKYIDPSGVTARPQDDKLESEGVLQWRSTYPEQQNLNGSSSRSGRLFTDLDDLIICQNVILSVAKDLCIIGNADHHPDDWGKTVELKYIDPSGATARPQDDKWEE